MWNGTPKILKKVQIYYDHMEKAYKQVGKRKNAALKGTLQQKLSCNNEHQIALASIQDSLRNLVKLLFLK